MPGNKAQGPFGSPVTYWSGYPDYRGQDEKGNVFWAYSPARARRSRADLALASE